MWWKRVLIPSQVLTLILLASSVVAKEADLSRAISGLWVGEIEVPGQPLEIQVNFRWGEDGSLGGNISIPAQGMTNQELTGVGVREGMVEFAIPGIPGEPSFQGAVRESENGGEELAGTFTQGSANLSFRLHREEREAGVTQETISDLEALAREAVDAWTLPGLGLAIVRGGKVVFAEGFGLRNVEDELPMGPDTLFAIGSSSKAFTTTVLATLVEEGRLQWDEPLRSYIPHFRLRDPVASERLTPRDLVTHRSGLPRHDLLWYNFNEGTRAELVARLAYLEANADLRQRFQYNNLMFAAAGFLAESLTGGTWEQAVRERIFQPLGMERSNFSVEDSKADVEFAYPYRLEAGGSEDGDSEAGGSEDGYTLERIPFRRLDLMGPAGSINSTLNEMAHWLAMNLGGGSVGTKKVLGAAALAELHRPQMATGRAAAGPELSTGAYAMGWFVDTYRGHRRIHHGGAIDGFDTALMLFPDDDLGLVAFTNRSSGVPELLCRHAVDQILGLEPIDWLGKALGRRDAAREASKVAREKKGEGTRRTGTQPSHSPEDYSGDYTHPGYGALSVSLVGDRLAFHFNNITTPLEHWHYEVWNGLEVEEDPTFHNMKLLFRGDLEGNIAAVELSLEPAVGPIQFDKVPPLHLSDPDYLGRLVGRYQLANRVARVDLVGGALVVTVPGQNPYPLIPTLSGRFALADYPTIGVGFQEGDDGRGESLTFYQPDGEYVGRRIADEE